MSRSALLLILSLTAVTRAEDAAPHNPLTEKEITEGWIALFDGAEELDFAGPWEVLSYWAGEVAQAEVEVVTVAASLEPIRAARSTSGTNSRPTRRSRRSTGG